MLLLPALIVAVFAPIQDGSQGLWRALPTPALCRSAPAMLDAPRLVRGSHLVVTRDDLESGQAAASTPALSLVAFASLLNEESRRESWNVTLHPNSPPLLARGPIPGCQSAADFCEQIDAAARGLEVDLSVWLVRGSGASAAGASAPKDAPWASARLRSGQETMFGERISQSYVHNYSVEVATDAGVAAPMVARALTGDVLHARVMRVHGGTSVYVEGLLDLSRLISLEQFELSATDLGSVQQPHISALQVAFSGSVTSGTPLRVAWGGLPGFEAAGEGSLWIVPRAIPDRTDGAWRVLDTALVEAAPWDLPQVAPGGGLEAVEEDPSDMASPQPIASSLLAKEGDTPRSSLSRARAPLFVAGNGVVLGPRAEQEGWAAIDDLRAAAESVHSRTGEVLVQLGAGFVRLPAASGARWRVLVCDETTAVIDYDVEIAPETWMPGPRVERRMDGFCVQGLAGADLTSYSAWLAATPEQLVAERSSIPLGRLELPRRTWRAAHGELRAAAAAQTVLAGTTPLTVSLRAP